MTSNAKGNVRAILLVVRILGWMSAVIVMAITAWAVVDSDSYRVIYPLVIAVLSTAFYIPAMIVSHMKRNRGYMLPLDIVFSFLWLAAFIFLSQHVRLGQQLSAGCQWFRFRFRSACTRKHSAEAFSFLAFFWTLCSMCLEIYNVYIAGKNSVAPDLRNEKRAQSDAPANQPGNIAAQPSV